MKKLALTLTALFALSAVSVAFADEPAANTGAPADTKMEKKEETKMETTEAQGHEGKMEGKKHKKHKKGKHHHEEKTEKMEGETH